MAQQRLGIIMNGVTGRMGMNQHLIRSIVAIRAQGGVALKNGDRVMPDPILVGRNADKVAALAKAHGNLRWTTDLDAALTDKKDTLFFDAATTQLRAELLKKAMKAGKHIYCEKPVSDTLKDALDLVRAAKKAGIKHGVVQDKLFLPGLLKLKVLIDSGFFGRMLSVRGEFGYWVFEGDWQPAQRPSWNYKKAEGGGIILDMVCHWRYVLDNLFGDVESVTCLGATHIPKRVGRERQDLQRRRRRRGLRDLPARGRRDRAHQHVVVHARAARRPRRRSMSTARTARRSPACRSAGASSGSTRRARCGIPDVPQPIDFFETWSEVPGLGNYDNGFKTQWEMFIRHLYDGAPFKWTLLEGAKGVQLVEAALKSWKERRWIDIPALKV